MALSEMGVSDHTGGSGSVYRRAADSGFTEIEAWAELLFRVDKGKRSLCARADVNVDNYVTSEAEHNHYQLHLFLFFVES